MRKKRRHTKKEKILLSKIPPGELELIEKLEQQIGLVNIESGYYGNIRIQNNHITEIWLVNGLLEEIPDCIHNLTELKSLNLDHNYLTSLPESLTQLTKLECLSLNGNNFMSLSESLSSWFIEREETGCIITGISTKRIKTLRGIPPWVLPPGELEFIEKLELQIGLVHIEDESDNHGNIRIENNHITEIILVNNSLTEIPDCIHNLTELKSLNLDHNYLTSLPESLTQLTKLEYLCLHWNNFMSLSESLSRWFIEREEAGCEITGISTKRIKTLWEIPPEEKEFILELEKFEKKLLPLWLDSPVDSGDGSMVSFFSAEGGHITILRIKDESCEGNSTGISEILSHIGNLKNLKE